MPGEESGAGRVKAPDLYRVRVVCRFPIIPCKGLRAQSTAMRMLTLREFENEDLKIEDELTMD